MWTLSYGEHEDRTILLHQLVQEGERNRIEEVRIVDHERQPPATVAEDAASFGQEAPGIDRVARRAGP